MAEGLLPSARVQTADGLASLTAPVTVGNVATETLLMSYTVGSNALAVGTTIIMLAGGVAGNVVTAVPTLTLRVRKGGVTGLLLGTILIATPATANTNKGWLFESIITCRAVGTGGTVMLQGYCSNELSTVAPNFLKHMAVTAALAWDTTIQNTLDLTAQWSAANAANTITAHNGLYLLSKA